MGGKQVRGAGGEAGRGCWCSCAARWLPEIADSPPGPRRARARGPAAAPV